MSIPNYGNQMTLEELDNLARQYSGNPSPGNVNAPKSYLKQPASSKAYRKSTQVPKANGYRFASNVVEGATDIGDTAEGLARFINKDFNLKNIVNYNAKNGLSLGGKSVGKLIPVGVTIYQLLDALGGWNEMSDINEDARGIESQILASAAGNPILNKQLSSEDLNLLNKLRRGNYSAVSDLSGATSNMGNMLSSVGTGALMGLAGGVPGALAGAIGGAINAGIDNMNAETTGNISELEALYQRVLDAEQRFKSMQRPNLNGFNIQQKYQDMYM